MSAQSRPRECAVSAPRVRSLDPASAQSQPRERAVSAPRVRSLGIASAQSPSRAVASLLARHRSCPSGGRCLLRCIREIMKSFFSGY